MISGKQLLFHDRKEDMNRSCDTVFNNRNDVKQGEIRQRIMKLAAVLLILVLVAWTGALRPASYAAKKKTATKTTKTKTSKTTKTAA